MAERVRIGVIGCGAIAKHLHVPDYHVCPEAEIVALCDILPEKAEALAGQFAPGAKIYSDYRDLLKDKNVDAVSVCLPNVLHGPVTIDAVNAGKHVLVEKPMATSVAEAHAMMDAAKAAGVQLLVNQAQRRFGPHRKAKEVLDSGIMGEVLYVTAMFGHSGPENWSPTGKWFFDKKQARFGAMADLGVHKADLIRFLTGKEVTEIAAFYDRLDKPYGDVEDNFAACLRLEGGAMGTLGASWTVKGGKNADYTILHCTNGTLRVLAWPDQPCIAHLVKPQSTIEFDIPPPLNEYGAGWGVDIGGAFVRAILGTEEPFCTGDEGMRSLAVILAAEEAADSGRTVKVRYTP